jgi:hypothetical protein
MVAPLTPKPTRKAEALAKAPPTIASRCRGVTIKKKWTLFNIVFPFFLRKPFRKVQAVAYTSTFLYKRMFREDADQAINSANPF